MDSDDVVLGFLVAPGAGTNGVPLQELFAFSRVHVRAGDTAIVRLAATGIAFTQAGADGLRRVLPGAYGVRIGVRETLAGGGGFVQLRVDAA